MPRRHAYTSGGHAADKTWIHWRNLLRSTGIRTASLTPREERYTSSISRNAASGGKMNRASPKPREHSRVREVLCARQIDIAASQGGCYIGPRRGEPNFYDVMKKLGAKQAGGNERERERKMRRRKGKASDYCAWKHVVQRWSAMHSGSDPLGGGVSWLVKSAQAGRREGGWMSGVPLGFRSNVR